MTQALVVWPPKISGSSAGTITNAASSPIPIERGREKKGRSRIRLTMPIATSRIARPPAIAARLASSDHSSCTAPSSSARKTSASSGTARLKTSVDALKSSSKSGRPAWWKRSR